MKIQSCHGIALIAGAAGILVTMGVHPAGMEGLSPTDAVAMNHINVMAHALGIASLPFIVFGYLGILRRTGLENPLSVFAFITYCFSAVATMVAAIASGLVASSIADGMPGAGAVVQHNMEGWLGYTHLINQACATVFAFGASIATICWAYVILSSGRVERFVGILGLVAGGATLAGLLAGHLRMDVHGFGLIVLGQALWAIAVGVWMMRTKDSSMDGAVAKQFPA